MQRLIEIFSSPVWGDRHNPLALGWSEAQLLPVVERLQPCLPDGLTPNTILAAAACARSLVVEKTLTGKPLRYSRGKEVYRVPKRYRCGDPLFTWQYVTRAMDVLHQAGLIEHDMGVWCGATGGRQSVAWATDSLSELIGSVVEIGEEPALPPQAEVIVLRDRRDKQDIDYDDTVETAGMRAGVEALNQALGQLRLYRRGEPFPIPSMRRVFNGSLDRGGRCYCHGTSFQNIPSQERLDLHLLIAGVLHPVVEIDYANLHAVMAYTKAGLPIPPGDQYEIDGFDRVVVKRAFNVLLNATKRHKAVAALVEDLHHKDDELWEHSGLATRLRSECYPFAGKVVAAVGEKHHRIAAFFGTDCGASFQRRDSDMAVQVMLRMIAITGRCPLPVHDSFLVADIDQEALAAVMQEVASEEELPLCLKASSGLCH